MIFESYYWKKDLIKEKRRIEKYNTSAAFDKNEEFASSVIERGIFYSAFIIRKLIDCRTKLSDEAERYQLQVERIDAIENITIMTGNPDDKTHDWDNAKMITVQGKDICNWLVHSILFGYYINEIGEKGINGFWVCSDYDRNKYLYSISIDDWLKYIEFIAYDNIVSEEFAFDVEKKDYFYIKKQRG